MNNDALNHDKFKIFLEITKMNIFTSNAWDIEITNVVPNLLYKKDFNIFPRRLIKACFALSCMSKFTFQERLWSFGLLVPSPQI